MATPQEVLEKLRSMSDPDFEKWRQNYGGGGGATREWYATHIVYEPENEARLCYHLGLPTEAEKLHAASIRSAEAAIKSAEATIDSAQSSKISAQAAVDSAKSAKDSVGLSKVAIVVSIASAAFSLLSAIAAFLAIKN